MNLFRRLDFILIGLSLLLLPFLWISFYVHPAADDFAYGWSTKFVGYWASNIRDFFNWNGRYFSNLLVFLNPISKGSFIGYQWVALFLILFSLFVFHIFLRLSFKQFISSKISWTISLLFVLLYLSAMPQLAQGIYWYTGAITYQTGILLSMLVIGMQLQSLHRTKESLGRKLLLASLIFCAIGCSETTMLHLLLFQLFLVYKTRRKREMWLLLFSLGCASLVLFSPGNSIRAAQFSEGGKFAHSFFYSVFQTIRFSVTWLSFLPLFIASFLAIPLFSEIRVEEKQVPFKISVTEIGLLIFLILFISAFPAYWATGILGQHRTINVACWWFLLMWFLLLFQLVNKYKHTDTLLQLQMLLQKRFTWIALCLMLSFFYKGNLSDLSKDLLFSKAKKYDEQMNQRYLIISESKGKDCLVDSLKDVPLTIYSFDISKDSSYWMNRGEAAYFELKSLGIKN